MEQINKKIKETNILGTEEIGKLIKKFAVPGVIAMLVNSLYNIVDQIFIGQGVGYLGNAATNVAFPVVTISLALALLIGNGAAAYYSLKLGENNKKRAQMGVGNAVTLMVVASIIIFVLALICIDPMLRLFGATEAVMPYAVEYTKVSIFGLPFVIVGVAMNSIIRADGSPKYAMYSMISGAVINTILNPIFIFGFNMGVAGSAFATVIGQFIVFVISILYIKKFKNIKFESKCLKLDLPVVKTMISFGASSFITQATITVVMIVMNNALVFYGAQSQYGSDIPLSALGIVMKVNQILMSILLGIATGAQPIQGYNYGAKKYDRVKETYVKSASIATVFAIVGFILFMVFPQYIINIFGDSDALYNEFAIMCFRIFLMLSFTTGFQVVSAIYFQAIGRPTTSSLLSLSRQMLFLVPLVLVLPHFFGITGILYAGPVADGASFLLTGILILNEMKSLNSKYVEA